MLEEAKPSLLVTFPLLVAWVGGGAYFLRHKFRVDTYLDAFYALYMSLARVNLLAAHGQPQLYTLIPVLLYLLIGIALVAICLDAGVSGYGRMLSSLHSVMLGIGPRNGDE